MSINKYGPHILVVPEDDANRQIANGFILHPDINGRAIQVLPPAGGWMRVVEDFTADHASGLRQYDQRRLVMLIDFDDERERRFECIKRQVPQELDNRVFILGVLSNPENLRKSINVKYEGIGRALSEDCAKDRHEMWGHALLAHNEGELERMILDVKPFLFVP
ncbi:hypothetical protein [Desulfomonile tiedjei]|uniref:Uncharacterized protein n=1 Tax=Desulfomonile tiedjei (strain ATCC 49306 / DSM 6799 / DCB-1) TaxID=706587 RepID=I4C1P9_DESTA|nr:hypothetical protein [Desulfomonile tiedjei]AFM23490.1 hypothetical protein Desti_0765 [Desulfomonile tiedjei DSM 6799]